MIYITYNKFMRWFHEFSVTTNLRFFQETEFVYLFLCGTNVNNNTEKICRFVVTEFVKTI